jgi:glutamate N-acetyltransferase / amino-acid N-acetyltransferase
MIPLPKRFIASGLHCGIKASGKHDLSLVVSEVEAYASGVFTTNKVYAAPVGVSRRHLQESGGKARGVIVSSGNANAATGEEGRHIASAMCEKAAVLLKCNTSQMLIGQTGLIGVPLNRDLCVNGVERAYHLLSSKGGVDAALGMMTTDMHPKYASAFVERDDTLGMIVGLGKGVAMACPSMATMIVTVLTDIPLSPSFLPYALRKAVDESFHMLSIDGCQSTNDTVFLLSNGASGGEVIDMGLHDDATVFIAALKDVCLNLARQMASDAEGGAKRIECKVHGAASVHDARVAARKVVDSTLVKCAIAGEAPYWGRVIAEVGASQVLLDPERIDISFGGILVCKNGISFPFDEARVHDYMRGSLIEIDVMLHQGSSYATAFGSDLTPEYVRINMDKS